MVAPYVIMVTVATRRIKDNIKITPGSKHFFDLSMFYRLTGYTAVFSYRLRLSPTKNTILKIWNEQETNSGEENCTIKLSIFRSIT